MNVRNLAALNLLKVAEEENLRAKHRNNEALLRSFTDPIKRLADAAFQKRYRLSKEAFKFLSDQLGRHTDLRSSQRTSRDSKILTTLSAYKCGLRQHVMGRGQMSQVAVSNFVEEVTVALNHPDIVGQAIKFPTSPEAREAIKQRFHQKYGLSGVIGVMDGTHVRIYTPHKDTRQTYYCRENFYSLNVQMVCDDECRIIGVNPKYGGTAYDAFIWENSALNSYMRTLHRTDPTCWLLGDSGYPLRPWLMTPFTDAPDESPEAYYSQAHDRARAVIKKTVDSLRNEFRCLSGERPLHYVPEKCAQVIVACCVLHNIALDYGLPEPGQEMPEVEKFTRPEMIEEPRGSIDLNRAHAIRNKIVRELMAAF